MKTIKRVFVAIRTPLACITLAFIISSLVLICTGYNPLVVFWQLIYGVFSKPKYIAWTLLKAQPIIITGLSVAFAFRTGLFNIGVEGQYTIGLTTAALVGYYTKLPPVIHPLFVMLCAMTVAGLYGMLSGYLKSKFGVHEVISGIMLNWIAFYLHNAIVAAPFFSADINKSFVIQPTATTMILDGWKKSDAGRAFLDGIPWLKEIFSTPLNVGLLLAPLFAIAAYIILKRTRAGFEMRAVGSGIGAAEHSGINIAKRMLMAMFIAGALAGAAGALQLMGVTSPSRLSHLAAMEGYGFNGLAVALMGNTSPLGCVISGLFFAMLMYGGSKVNAPPASAPPEVVSIVIGIILLCVAAPFIIEKLFALKRKRRDGA